MNNWTQLGLSVPIIAVFLLAMMKLLRGQTYYETSSWQIIASLTVLAIALWIRSKLLKDSKKHHLPEEKEDITRGFLAALVSPAYCRPMLNIFGAIALLITPACGKKTEIPPSPASATNVQTELPFPDLKMQGITSKRNNDSSVLINGDTFFVGDEIEGAKLLEVGVDSATFDWQGREHKIFLGR